MFLAISFMLWHNIGQKFEMTSYSTDTDDVMTPTSADVTILELDAGVDQTSGGAERQRHVTTDSTFNYTRQRTAHYSGGGGGNVSRLSSGNASRLSGVGAGSRWLHAVDCSGANRGLFAGIFVLVLTVVGVAVFFVYDRGLSLVICMCYY